MATVEILGRMTPGSKGPVFESTLRICIQIGEDDGALDEAYSEYDADTLLSPGHNLTAARPHPMNFWGKIIGDYVHNLCAGGHGGLPPGFEEASPDVIVKALWPAFQTNVADRLAKDAMAWRDQATLKVVRCYGESIPEEKILEAHRLAICASVGVPREPGGPPTV